MVRFWGGPTAATLPDLLRNYADGIDTGDIEYGLWSAHCYCYHLYYSGTPLPRVHSEVSGMLQAMRHHKQLAPLAVTVPLSEMVIYETHLKGYTQRHPEVPEGLRGTYAGFADDDDFRHGFGGDRRRQHRGAGKRALKEVGKSARARQDHAVRADQHRATAFYGGPTHQR